LIAHPDIFEIHRTSIGLLGKGVSWEKMKSRILSSGVFFVLAPGFLPVHHSPVRRLCFETAS
jgi:hypothetical protein